MKKRRNTVARPGQPADKFDWITGRIVQITALVTAIGGLGLAIATPAGTVRDLFARLRGQPPACLLAETLDVPGKVKYSEWERMTIKLKGQNTCSMPRGVYVTLDIPKRVLFLQKDPNCEGSGAWQDPACWAASKKPVDRGTWQVDFEPPPLERVGNLGPVERISLRWQVRDSDAPTHPALRIDSTNIDVENDIAQLH